MLSCKPGPWPFQAGARYLSVLTDVVILDVDDELGQRVEVKSAAPEPASVGKEGSSGDACHGRCSIRNEGKRRGNSGADSGGNSWSSHWQQADFSQLRQTSWRHLMTPEVRLFDFH